MDNSHISTLRFRIAKDSLLSFVGFLKSDGLFVVLVDVLIQLWYESECVQLEKHLILLDCCQYIDVAQREGGVCGL